MSLDALIVTKIIKKMHYNLEEKNYNKKLRNKSNVRIIGKLFSKPLSLNNKNRKKWWIKSGKWSRHPIKIYNTVESVEVKSNKCARLSLIPLSQVHNNLLVINLLAFLHIKSIGIDSKITIVLIVLLISILPKRRRNST